MLNEEQLDDLLVAWGNEREQGNDLSAQELCKDCPELADEMASRIRDLRAMSWLMEPDDDSDDDFLSLPDFITGTAVVLPSSLSLEEFLGRIVESGLMTASEIDDFRDTVNVEDAQQLANELIREKRLTAYQARTLGEGNVRGLVLGNYVILDKIGSGGMGQVFKARHKRMKRRVAIKVLPPGAVDTPKAADRFQREVEAAAKLDHPNIVTAFDADEADGVHFLVMQYVDGKDLSVIVKEQGPLSVAKAVRCMVQAAKGLQYAHDKGVTHRDVKPANLLLDNVGNIKLLDMGLARIEPAANGDGFVATQAELTQPDAVMGTVDYMSPEQAVDTKHADGRADIYSLGCTLYYILTGKPPYTGNTLMARMIAHREADIPSLSDEREDVSEQLDNIFKRMLAKNPEDRYPTMTALLEDVEVIAAELDSLAGSEDDASSSVPSVTDIRTKDTAADTSTETLPSVRPIPAPVPAKKPAPRTKWRVVAGGGVAVLLLAVLGYWLFGVIFRIDTGNGIIQIETNVPDVEVFVDDEKVVYITDPKDKTKIEVEVFPGAETLKVTKDGFEADVAEFKLDTVKGPIKVTFVPVEGQPVSSGDVERDVAEWVLEHGGTIQVDFGNERKPVAVERATALPEGSFRVRAIGFNGGVDEALLHPLKQLPHLAILDLTYATLSDNAWKELSTLGSVRDINLFRVETDEHKIAQLASVNTLRQLKLQVASDEELLAIANLRQLTDLHLVCDPRTYKDGLPCFARLAKLESLHIGMHKDAVIDDVLSDVANLQSLRSLHVPGHHLSENDWTHLAALTALETLDIPGANHTSAGIVNLGTLKKLSHVNLSNSDISDDGLAALSELGSLVLRSFDLAGTSITDSGLKHLSKLTSLTDLILTGTEVTAEGVADLQKALPNCRIDWEGAGK